MLMQTCTWFSALLMALPMCWCCLVTGMPIQAPAADDAACPACHVGAHTQSGKTSDARDPHAPLPACCLDANTARTVTPALAAAPQPVLVDLQTTVWEPAESFRPSGFLELSLFRGLRQAQAPPLGDTPLYHRHCALLI